MSLQTSNMPIKPLIMFVDDDPLILASIHRQLARRLTDYDFVFCDSGTKALEEAQIRTPNLVFSDMRMPGMDGLAFLTEFLRRHPGIDCFVITGQFAPAERQKIEMLVKKVLFKPIDCSEIGQIVQLMIPRPNLD